MSAIPNEPYELIVSIVNNGYTDLVMEGARKAGARGGTVLTARGTGNPDIEKFFGIVITPEKEVVMILVPRDIRDQVLEAINASAGMSTRGQGIAFSMGVSDTVGLQPVEKEEIKVGEERKESE